MEIRDWFEFIINNIPGKSGFFLKKFYKNIFKGSYKIVEFKSIFVASALEIFLEIIFT